MRVSEIHVKRIRVNQGLGVSESVNFIEKVSPYLARPEVEMDPKRVFSTQH